MATYNNSISLKFVFENNATYTYTLDNLADENIVANTVREKVQALNTEIATKEIDSLYAFLSKTADGSRYYLKTIEDVKIISEMDEQLI